MTPSQTQYTDSTWHPPNHSIQTVHDTLPNTVYRQYMTPSKTQYTDST